LNQSLTVLDGYDRAVLWRVVYPGGIAMSSKRAVLIAGVSLLFVPAAVLAHHGLDAQFDTKKTITLTGAVTKIDWSNPHVRLYIDVKDEGNTVTWEVDMGPPNLQLMNGWKIDTYRRGDQVRVDAYPARDGSNVGYGRKVTALQR
jgi:hypothetical protein